MEYMAGQLARGVRLSAMTRHVLGLYLGQPGARRWRRQLAEGACRPGAGIEVVRRAMAAIDPDTAAHHG